MGKQKLPISKKECADIERELEKLKGTKHERIFKAYLLFRYTGCHVSVITDKKYELREEMQEGYLRVIWNRPKKKGDDAYTRIKKHRKIYFNVGEFAKQMQNAKGRNTRLYFYRKIEKYSRDAGVSGVSPNTFRHTLAVELLDEGWSEIEVAQLLNCTVKTLREWYGKKQQKDLDKKLEKLGW